MAITQNVRRCESDLRNEGEMILAIDPGTTKSGYCIIEKYKPVQFGIVDNDEMIKIIKEKTFDKIVIEQIKSYGQAVGQTTLDTCVWIGRYMQVGSGSARQVLVIPRMDVKMNICKTSRANDSTIRQALIDRFAYDQPNKGKGTKDNPGWFYGFRGDVWQAYALGVTVQDMK